MKGLLVILERYLSQDGDKLRFAGVVTRDVAHYQGVPHGSVQVAIIAPVAVAGKATPHVLLGWRSKWKKTSPETWDVCGGHVDADKEILDSPAWDDQDYVKKIFDETAIREANEELHYKGKKPFSEANVKCFGGLGVFDCGFDDPQATNKEHSALYLAFIASSELVVESPAKVEEIFEVKDSVGIAGQELEESVSRLKLVTLPELALDFTKNPSSYADGIARVLRVLNSQPGTMQVLNEFIESRYQGAAWEGR
jgi:8-oxo-dGTP pyrophosphatase MutT (NUDIX family)